VADNGWKAAASTDSVDCFHGVVELCCLSGEGWASIGDDCVLSSISIFRRCLHKWNFEEITMKWDERISRVDFLLKEIADFMILGVFLFQMFGKRASGRKRNPIVKKVIA